MKYLRLMPKHHTKNTPAIFLDRDGVINYERTDYVKNLSEFQFIDGALEALKILTNTGFPIVVVTNQSVVGRGLLSMSGLDRIHAYMINETSRSGGKIQAIYFCPHAPVDRCNCRTIYFS